MELERRESFGKSKASKTISIGGIEFYLSFPKARGGGKIVYIYDIETGILVKPILGSVGDAEWWIDKNINLINNRLEPYRDRSSGFQQSLF